MTVNVGMVITAGLAGLAVAGLVPSPANRLRSGIKTTVSDPEQNTPRWAVATRPPGLRGLVRGRPDGLPLGRRVIVSIVVALAVAFVVGGREPSVGGVAWALAPLMTVAGVVVLGTLEPLASRRRRHRLIMESPAALELLAAALAAGLPPRTATEAVVKVFDGPLAEDLAVVLSAVKMGMSDALAWRSLRDHPTLGEAACDLARSVESGTMMVETLAQHARTARQRRQSEVEVAAKALGVRCVPPMMICFIPAFLLLGIVPTVVSAFLAVLPVGLLGPP
jgi:pilus assembly protein TadC